MLDTFYLFMYSVLQQSYKCMNSRFYPDAFILSMEVLPTDRPTDIRGHREVTLPIINIQMMAIYI